MTVLATAVQKLTEFTEQEVKKPVVTTRVPTVTSSSSLTTSSSASSSASSMSSSCASFEATMMAHFGALSLPSGRKPDVSLTAPHASDEWQALLALRVAGEDPAKYIQHAKVTYAESAHAGSGVVFATVGELWARVTWPHLPPNVELLDYGAPWPAHFLEKVQRSVIPLVPHQVEAMRTEMKQIKKLKATSFNDFLVLLENKVAEFTESTGQEVNKEEKVSILMTAVQPDDECYRILAPAFTHLMREQRGQVDYHDLVNDVASSMRLLTRPSEVQTAAVTVLCSNCGKSNHDFQSCWKKGGGAYDPNRSSSSSSSTRATKTGKAGGRGRNEHQKKGERKERKPSGNDQKSNACFNCGQSGHWAAECPEPTRKGGKPPRRSPGTAVSCDKCGGLGHERAQCSSTKRAISAARKVQQAEKKEKPPGAGKKKKQVRAKPDEPGTSAMVPVAEVSAPVVEVSVGNDDAYCIDPVVVEPAEAIEGTATARPPPTRVYVHRDGKRHRVLWHKGVGVVYLDSGADVHIWNDRASIQNLRKAPPILVHGYDGKGSRYLDQVGEVRLEGEHGGITTTVYYCPQASMSLLSVHALCKDDEHVSVVFRARYAEVQWQESEKTRPVCLLRASVSVGHYEVDLTNNATVTAAHAASRGIRMLAAESAGAGGSDDPPPPDKSKKPEADDDVTPNASDVDKSEAKQDVAGDDDDEDKDKDEDDDTSWKRKETRSAESSAAGSSASAPASSTAPSKAAARKASAKAAPPSKSATASKPARRRRSRSRRGSEPSAADGERGRSLDRLHLQPDQGKPWRS